MKKVPANEREQVDNDLVAIAERLMKYGTIPECRVYLRERLSVSV